MSVNIKQYYYPALIGTVLANSYSKNCASLNQEWQTRLT